MGIIRIDDKALGKFRHIKREMNKGRYYNWRLYSWNKFFTEILERPDKFKEFCEKCNI